RSRMPASARSRQEIGATVRQVPYRGAGPALNDLLAAHADLGCQAAAVVGPLIKASKLKGYAILGKSRFSGLPDVPTTAEAGYKKRDRGFWHILFAPAGTPEPIVDRLNAALRHALADATVRKTFDEGAWSCSRPTNRRRKQRARCSSARSSSGATSSAPTTSP